MPKIRILLLTNRDSDNVGDQIIEASVISVIKGVMKNLDIPTSEYMISSRAAGIISKKYMKTKDPDLLKDARQEISAADVVIFGGAPLFNYTYQNFYLRTIYTLELAQEYGVPVLFSSIGVEPYDENSPKSMALKEALALPCVRQITTRDDLDSVQKYMQGTDTPVAHVCDPAVFADVVFRKAPPAPPKPVEPAAPQRSGLQSKIRTISRLVLGHDDQPPLPHTIVKPAATTEEPKEQQEPQKKRIGLVVTRAGIFKDNGITFSEKDQRTFWLDTIKLLTERGYDYRLFTTGHFSDEVFLDSLVKSEGIPGSKAAVTVNSPEELIKHLRACDGVIAYRLHASITSFAFDIPSIGLSWNFKVPYFYESVGYGERALPPEQWKAPVVVDAIEAAMAAGVTKDEAFHMSVYDTLFAGLKDIFSPAGDVEPFTHAQLRTELPRYTGTSQKQYQEKVRRKMRRTYENYQKLMDYRSKNEKAAKSGR